MLEAMEHKNGNICGDSDYICGEEHEILMTITLYLMPSEKIPGNIYIWISEPTNDAKDILKGNDIVYLLDNG